MSNHCFVCESSENITFAHRQKNISLISLILLYTVLIKQNSAITKYKLFENNHFGLTINIKFFHFLISNHPGNSFNSSFDNPFPLFGRHRNLARYICTSVQLIVCFYQVQLVWSSFVTWEKNIWISNNMWISNKFKTLSVNQKWEVSKI